MLQQQVDALDHTTVFCSNPTNFWELHQMQFSFLISRCKVNFCETRWEFLSLEIPAKRAACSFKSAGSKFLSTVTGCSRRFGCAFNSTGFSPLLINLLNWGSHVWVRQNGSTTSIPPLPWIILAKIFIVRPIRAQYHYNTSNCERSMKLGTDVYQHILNFFWERATPICYVNADVSIF